MSPPEGHDTGIPKAITPTDVQRLLESWEISDPAGLRDYPIIMLVARFGLRSIEATRLQ
jgi:integrase